MLNLDYDKQFDILYARLPFCGHSYGEENEDGVITYHNIENDSVTGIAIYSFKKRLENGSISRIELPLSIDFWGSTIKKMVYA